MGQRCLEELKSSLHHPHPPAHPDSPFHKRHWRQKCEGVQPARGGSPRGCRNHCNESSPDYARTVIRLLKKGSRRWPNSEAGSCDRRICEEYRLARRLSGWGSEFQTDLGLDECRKRFFGELGEASWSSGDSRRGERGVVRERLRKDGPRCVEWFVGSGPRS